MPKLLLVPVTAGQPNVILEVTVPSGAVSATLLVSVGWPGIGGANASNSLLVALMAFSTE